jgi:ribosomal-protein-alanine N-acetyltransferase
MSTKNSNTVDVEIRKLRGDDEVYQCAQLMANSEPWITLRRNYEDSVNILRNSSKEIYVAVIKNEVTGFTILDMNGAFRGYIQSVAILPEWRNQGIGTKLIQFAEERIFRDFPNVFMCVSSFNENAQRLYTRLGYERIGELKDYIVSGHAEILLRKTIGPLREFQVVKDYKTYG